MKMFIAVVLTAAALSACSATLADNGQTQWSADFWAQHQHEGGGSEGSGGNASQ